jgi:hypothetical protein
VTGARRGAGIAELVVALALTALLSAAGAAALVGIERYVRRTVVDGDAQRVLREAEAVLVSEVRAAAADSVVVRGDTAVDLLTGVALSVACVASGSEFVLPSEVVAVGVPFTQLRSAPVAGDLLAAYDTVAGWRSARIDSVLWRADGAGCATTSGFRAARDSAARIPVLRIRLAAAVGGGVGSPVRIFRRGRYALVRGGDGSWGLAWRRCDLPEVCGPSQPVAGPLVAPFDSGLVLRLAADGGALSVRMRTPRATAPPATRALTIALRRGDARR